MYETAGNVNIHWRLDKLADILQTTFHMYLYERNFLRTFSFKFRWCLFLLVQSKLSQHWYRSESWFGTGQPTNLYLHQCWLRCLPPKGITRPQWIMERYTESLIYNCLQASLSQISIVTTKSSKCGNGCRLSNTVFANRCS